MLLGFVDRKERWGLSRRGWWSVLAILGGFFLFIFFGLYSFLAPNCANESRLLIMEGWVHTYAVNFAVELYKQGACDVIICTGGPVNGSGASTSVYDTSAHVGASRLIRAGIPKDKVIMVPSQRRSRDRTYWAGVALRKWLNENKPAANSVNILTEGVHARRSRLLYRKALGGNISVGIIAVPNPDYQPRAWWRYSEGFREVTGELIAYLYARILFLFSVGDSPD